MDLRTEGNAKVARLFKGKFSIVPSEEVELYKGKIDRGGEKTVFMR